MENEKKIEDSLATAELESFEATDKNVSQVAEAEVEDHERDIKLMSPMQMVLRRFFRSKLSVVGLLMIAFLFLFSFLSPATEAEARTMEARGAADSPSATILLSPIPFGTDTKSTEALPPCFFFLRLIPQVRQRSAGNQERR